MARRDKAIIPGVYPKNTAIVEALSRGEIAVGFVNHYYLESSSKKIPTRLWLTTLQMMSAP